MKPIHTHVFIVNESDNSGEQMSVTTQFIPNGDPGVVFMNNQITLRSYGNSADFNLSGIQLTPTILRKLANELEAANGEALRSLATKTKTARRRKIDG